ncbi:helix-turn-helix domain-containing protein [Spirillospora sp. NPDC000708]
MGSETSKTRSLLLDIVERLMLREGYAAVGVRRVAREAGVTPALIHYYFRTLDDLFLAVLRRRADQEFEAHTRALKSGRLVRTLWDYNRIPAGAALTMEFMALANHRKVIRSEFARNAERFRETQMQALGGYLKERGIEPDDLPPAALAVLISMIPRTLVLEDALGLTAGHAETLTFIERCIQAIDDRPAEEGQDPAGHGAPA